MDFDDLRLEVGNLFLHLLLIELKCFDLLRQLFQSLVKDRHALGDIGFGRRCSNGKHNTGAQDADKSEKVSWFHGGNLGISALRCKPAVVDLRRLKGEPPHLAIDLLDIARQSYFGTPN